MDITPETKKIAQALAKADRLSPDYGQEVGEGFRVPAWTFFVSEAWRLQRNQDALKTK